MDVRQRATWSQSSSLVGALRQRFTLYRLVRGVDRRRFRDLRAKYEGTDYGESKYWNLRERLALNLGHVYALGLNRTAPMDILDLGAGCGYFPYICRQFGHSALGADIAVPMYRDVTELLNVPWREWRIEAYQPSPDFGKRFDLVTALLIYFNNPHQPDVWDVDEWRYFLTDLVQRQLAPNGRIYLYLNQDLPGRFYSPALLDYLTGVGATVNGPTVYFDSIERIGYSNTR